jgi:hypothetical protein
MTFKTEIMKELFSIAFVMLCAFTGVPQKTDFSGTWILKDQKSISGTLYSNGVPKQIKILQNSDALTLESTTSNAQGEDVTTTESLPFDGKKFETTTASKRKKTSILSWDKDGKTFTRTSDLSQTTDTSKIEIKYTDIWSLDGGKLILLRKAENFNNGEEWEAKAIYEKQ